MPEKDIEEAPVTRKRKLPYRYQGRCSWRQYLLQPPWPTQVLADTTTDVDFSGTQITVSEGHLWPPPKGSGLTDTGGDFFTQKRYVEPGIKPVSREIRIPYGVDGWYSVGEFSGYVLPMNPLTPTLQFPPASNSSNDDLDEWGATAIARCKPTKSVADLSTALGELMKDGLPALPGSQSWKQKSASAKNAGSEFLGIQFGWLPMVSDIQKISRAIKNSDEILAQYERDSGKVVRRRYNFPSDPKSEETVWSTSARCYVPGAGSMVYSGTAEGTVIRVRETTQKRWFSGAFTYYLPSGYTSRNRISELSAKADILLGTKLTPETLWNLAPWSWAIDWFSSTGDVISNLQDFLSGDLVMRYGYIMEHTIVRDTYTIDKPGLRAEFGDFTCPPLTLVTETKIRRGANPFGFGVHWSSLSGLQTSILVALGLSRR